MAVPVTVLVIYQWVITIFIRHRHIINKIAQDFCPFDCCQL